MSTYHPRRIYNVTIGFFFNIAVICYFSQCFVTLIFTDLF